MTEEMIALGRRAVACKGWRWMDGMKANNDPEYGSVVSSCWSSSTSIRMPDWRMDDVMSGRWLPDLADPATLGCMLALVRESMNDEHAGVSWDLSGEEWVCDGEHVYNGKTYIGIFAQGPSYAEALVAALEAAREAAP